MKLPVGSTPEAIKERMRHSFAIHLQTHDDEADLGELAEATIRLCLEILLDLESRDFDLDRRLQVLLFKETRDNKMSYH